MGIRDVLHIGHTSAESETDGAERGEVMDAAPPVVAAAEQRDRHATDGPGQGGSILMAELASDSPSDGDGEAGEQDQKSRIHRVILP